MRAASRNISIVGLLRKREARGRGHVGEANSEGGKTADEPISQDPKRPRGRPRPSRVFEANSVRYSAEGGSASDHFVSQEVHENHPLLLDGVEDWSGVTMPPELLDGGHYCLRTQSDDSSGLSRRSANSVIQCGLKDMAGAGEHVFPKMYVGVNNSCSAFFVILLGPRRSRRGTGRKTLRSWPQHNDTNSANPLHKLHQPRLKARLAWFRVQTPQAPLGRFSVSYAKYRFSP